MGYGGNEGGCIRGGLRDHSLENTWRECFLHETYYVVPFNCNFLKVFLDTYYKTILFF